MMKLLVLFICLIPSSRSFEEISINFTIEEEQPDGTLLIDLDEYFRNQTDQTIRGYQREFLSSCPHLYFSSNDKEQPIDYWKILIKHLDREQLCPYDEQCDLICQLYLKKDEMKLLKLHLYVKDINDHRGKFRKKAYSYQLDEDLSPGYRFQLEQVEDEDYDCKNKSYYLKHSYNAEEFPFALSFNATQHLLELILVKPVDGDRQSFYQFQLIAQDQNQDEDQCELQIEILSNDIDSNPIPLFQQSVYDFFIENLQQKFIGRVHLDESVKGRNSNSNPIFFRLLSSNHQDEYLKLFQINSTTGEIYLKDFHSFANEHVLLDQPTYEVLVEAFNSNYLSSLTKVKIHFNLSEIKNSSSFAENEEVFEIFIPKLFQKSSVYSSESYSMSIEENSRVPLTLCQIFFTSSTETIEKKKKNRRFHLNSSFDLDSFHLKQIDEQVYELILLKPFDYEKITEVSIDFILSEENDRIKLKKSLEIFIENLNDCPPSFSQTDFYFRIEENNFYPMKFFTFSAEDPDQINPSLSYALKYFSSNHEAEYEKIFQINATNGDFYLLQSFDRELQSNYSFQVCAFDQIFQTCSTIHFEILDQNDNQCSFNSSTSRLDVFVYENLPLNTFLTQFVAFDPDQGENGTLFYSLESSSMYLHLNSTNGILRTTSIPFDYESIQNFSTVIFACDNVRSSHSLCCSIELFLHIRDKNDHQPYLIYPSSNPNDIFIIQYLNQTMMPVIKAFDQDLDQENNQINFTILGGTLNSSLTIHPKTGQLLLRNPSSSLQFPLYGTLLLSLSLETNILLTLLIHDNQTNPEHFLKSIQSSAFSFNYYYYYYFILFILLLLFLPFIFLIPHFCRRTLQHKEQRHHHSLITTTSTTTLSSKSLSNPKKLFETYYSFGDTLTPNMTQI